MGLGRPADTDPHLLNRGLRENPGSFLQVLPDPTPSPGRLSLAGHQGAPPPTVGLSPPPPSGPSPAGPSPTVHPIQSPQNRFCVLTLDPETLPAIATTLIDVLFYSHSPPREAASGGPGSSSITFFAFSLIEGYISIVMDAETQKK